ncbi:MAG: YihY family inner membrane protein [Betaproteobacteria bacterium]|nr:YihY family inner membrane protein [Betaproteobacteria bacterium]
MSWLFRFLRALVGFPRHLAHVFARERLPQMAAALSFSTLLALVPLVTLVLAAASHLPGFGDLITKLDAWFMRALLPEHAGGQVARQILALAESASSLSWTWALALTGMVFLLLHELEDAFNRVWGAKSGRAWKKRLPLYLIGMFGTPFTMGILTSLSNLLLNLAVEGIVEQKAFIKWMDITLFGVFFALLYHALPNARVSRTAALIGGAIVSLLLSSMKEGLRWYVTQTGFYDRLYGALAALPVFLLWLYLAWLLVLAVAVFVARLDAEKDRFKARS